MNHSWDGYRIFTAAAEAGSLRGASQLLGLSQPTVGRRLTAFEARLGVRLFDRGPEGLRLTEAGARALSPARELARGAVALESQLRGEDDSEDRRVRIAATTTLGVQSVTPRLADLRERQPELRIDLLYGLGLVDLLRGEADLVLRQSKPGSPDLVGRKIARIEIGLWAGAAYLERSRPPRSRTELGRHALIEPFGELARMPGASWLRTTQGNRQPAVRCSELLGIAALVGAGMGIGLLPRYAADSLTDLHPVLPRLAHWDTDLWLLTRRDLRSNRSVRAVLDSLSESYRGARL